MAWEWSHTQEAYDNARDNLTKWKRPKLEVVYGEWFAHDGSEFREDAYHDGVRAAEKMTHEGLVEDIFGRARAQRLCTNGGHRAWMCPYGCEVHMVSFDKEK